MQLVLQQLLSQVLPRPLLCLQLASTQQQAWLPQRTAASRLNQTFHEVFQRVAEELLGQPQPSALQACSPTQQCLAAALPAWRATHSLRNHHMQPLTLSHRPGSHHCWLNPAVGHFLLRHAHTAAFASEHIHRSGSAAHHKRRSKSSKVGRLLRPLLHQHMDMVGEGVFEVAAAVDSHPCGVKGEARADPTDLRHPEQWYPLARAMAPRSLTGHLGPTNRYVMHLRAEAGAACWVCGA